MTATGVGRIKPTEENYAEWQMAFDHINVELFDGQLPDCLITMQREKHTMGYFSLNRFSNRLGRKVDEIALNPSYFLSYGVNEALQTLAHEMCHLWQYHFGDPGRGRYHNKEWAEKMQSIGLMPSSTGAPGGRKTGDKIADYIISGGLFEASINRLKKEKGFELIWMDRFIARPMAGTPSYLSALGVEGSSFQSEDFVRDDDDDQNEWQTIQMMAQAVEPDFTRLTQKQGTRLKYSCNCGINLWAKPGIDVTCNICESLFQAQTED